MKLTLIAILSTLLGAASPAFADQPKSNGRYVNGVAAQSRWANSRWVNSRWGNGRYINGVYPNGINENGINENGLRNGINKNGMRRQGPWLPIDDNGGLELTGVRLEGGRLVPVAGAR